MGSQANQWLGKGTYTLKTRRSDVIRSPLERAILDADGNRVLGIRVSCAYLSFLNASKVGELVKKALEQETTPCQSLLVVILEMTGVEGVDSTGLSMLEEVLESCYRQECEVVLALSPDSEVEKAISKFGLPMISLQPDKASEIDVKKSHNDASFILVEKVLVSNPADSSLNYSVKAEVTAITVAEEYVIASTHRQSADLMIPPPVVGGGNSRNSTSSSLENNMILPVLTDMQTSSIAIANCLTAVTLDPYEILYAPPPSEGENPPEKAPPIVWLVRGSLAHTTTTSTSTQQHRIEYAYEPYHPGGNATTNDKECCGYSTGFGDFSSALKRVSISLATSTKIHNQSRDYGRRLSMTQSQSQSYQSCVGYFGTDTSFFAGLSHSGRLFAGDSGAHVIVLKRENYDKLCRSDPEAGIYLREYLARRKYVGY